MQLLSAAALALAVSHVVARSDDGLVLHTLSTARAAQFGAACLAGDPPGFYYRFPAPNSPSTKWRIHFRGGGWCFTAADCLSRASSDLGSSKYFLPNISQTPNQYEGFMDELSSNPWGDWNLVFAQYCDGTSWTSARDAPLSVGNASLWFRGHNNLLAVMSELDVLGGLLTNATDVVLTGTSAGGLATYLVHGHVRRMLQQSTRLVGMPDSGYFLDYPNTHGDPAYRTSFQNAVGPELWNATAGTHQACVANTSSQDVWQCFFAQYVYPYAEVPFFIANSMADEWQTDNILQLPCNPQSNCNATQMATFHDFQVALQTTIMQTSLLHPNDGYYLSSCFQHGQTCADGDWFSANIGGSSENSTFFNWYYGTGGVTRVHSNPFPDPNYCAYNATHGWC